MKKFLLIIFIILLVISSGIGAYLYLNQIKNEEKNKEIEKIKKDYENQIDELKKQNEDLEKETKKESENNNQTGTKSENIIVENPKENTKISSPVIISGQAKVYEGTVYINIKDKNGSILASTFTTASMKDTNQFGPFSKSIDFKFKSGENGIIEVFSVSQKDGSTADITTVPIKFK